MAKIAVSLLLGLAAGFGLALWSADDGAPPPLSGPSATPGSPAPPAAGATAELQRRLSALERAVEQERTARQSLAETVASLTGVDPAADAADAALSGPALAHAPAQGQVPMPPIESSGIVEVQLDQRLVSAGFSPDRAAFIASRIETLQLEQMQARYAAQRSGDRTALRGRQSLDDVLRVELSEPEYERYLSATGRPIDVPIGNVIANSPAEMAGLQSGDRIVGYGGERVYSMNDISRLTLAGTAGETIVVDVERDGQTLQLYVPRGPLGISGARGRRPPR